MCLVGLSDCGVWRRRRESCNFYTQNRRQTSVHGSLRVFRINQSVRLGQGPGSITGSVGSIVSTANITRTVVACLQRARRSVIPDRSETDILSRAVSQGQTRFSSQSTDKNRCHAATTVRKCIAVPPEFNGALACR